jgi:hypothetical protein
MRLRTDDQTLEPLILYQYEYVLVKYILYQYRSKFYLANDRG